MLSFWNKRRSLSGFTLVELLAVIMIIAILIGTTLGAAQYIIKTARARRASTTGRALEIALATYRHEYNKWPVPLDSTSQPTTNAFSGADNKTVFSALLAERTTDSDLFPGNRNGVQFLDETTVFTYVSGQGFIRLSKMTGKDTTQYPLAYMDRNGRVQYYKVTFNFEDDTVKVTPPD